MSVLNSVTYLDFGRNSSSGKCCFCQIKSSKSWLLEDNSLLLSCNGCVESAPLSPGWSVIECHQCKNTSSSLVQPHNMPFEQFLCINCNDKETARTVSPLVSISCQRCSSSGPLLNGLCQPCRIPRKLSSLASILSLVDGPATSTGSSLLRSGSTSASSSSFHSHPQISHAKSGLYSNEPITPTFSNPSSPPYRLSNLSLNNIHTKPPAGLVQRSNSADNNTLYHDESISPLSRHSDSPRENHSSCDDKSVPVCQICYKSTTNRWVRDKFSAGLICYNCYQKRNRSGSFVDVLPDGSTRERICTKCSCNTSSRWHKDRDDGKLPGDMFFKCNACYRKSKRK